MAQKKREGSVKFFKWTDKGGYGFIEHKDPNTDEIRDIYFNKYGLDDPSEVPERHDLVEFETTGTPRGPKAVNVKRVG